MSNEIKFGTDGWRAPIADGFTFKNVGRVAQAACEVIRKTSKSRLILVGYDNRFFSDRFAHLASKVAEANGFRVEICESPVSSPLLSYVVKEKKAGGGFMITASHNPATFNGFKLKSPLGGSVDEAFTTQVEDRLDILPVQMNGREPKKVNFTPSYLSYLKKHFRQAALKHLKGSVIFDGMHGPGGRIFQEFCGESNKVLFIRSNADPMFGGVAPEPIEENLGALKKAVLEHKAVAGIAVDGDADRVGLVDDKGRYIPPHTVMPLLLLHLLESKKLKGKIVQTVSMGYLPKRVALSFKMPFQEVPVGFKYIAKLMHEEKILLGGEESGGYGIGLWFPERDGIISALLLIEMLIERKGTLSQLVDDLYKRFGESHFKRIDYRVALPADKAAWTANITTHIAPTVAGETVASVDSSDGIKINLQNEAWVLMRPSGTEPLIRTYAEAPSEKLLETLLEEAKRLIHIPMPNPKKSAADERKKKVKRKLKK